MCRAIIARKGGDVRTPSPPVGARGARAPRGLPSLAHDGAAPRGPATGDGEFLSRARSGDPSPSLLVGAFPRVLLQQALKVTFESPPGTKKNVQRTLAIWGREFFERGERRRPMLLLCLAV